MERIFNKKLGQNFLVSPGMQFKVTTAFRELIDNYPEVNILEIGPGDGDLSKNLLFYGGRFFMIETDPQKYEHLKNNLDLGKSNLILGDGYKVLPTFDKILGDKFVMVSNLPYYIGSRILVDLALYFPKTPFVVILQKEVVRKLIKSSKLTFFGLWLNLFWDFKILFDIKPGNFIPAPKVVSSCVIAIPKVNQDFIFQEREELKELLKKLLISPKKTVFNNLRIAGYIEEEIINIFKKNNFNIKLRLNWENYANVLTKLKILNKKSSKGGTLELRGG